MLQELFGYDAFHAGLVLSPSAFFTMAMMPIVGFLLGRKVDARYIIPVGLLCLAGASLLAGAPGPLHLALHVHRAPMPPDDRASGCCSCPLNNAAYLYLPEDQVNNATGLFNMLRNEGGSLGIAIVTVLVDRRSQFHQLRLAEHVTPLNPAVDRWTRLLRPDPHDPRRSHPGRGPAARHGPALADGPQPGAGDGLSRPLLDLRDHGPGGPPAGLAHEEGGIQGRGHDALSGWLQQARTAAS